MRKRGQDRVLHILDVGLRILAGEGYAKFSLRSVAAASGIELGNLQYYFRTKQDLLRAVLEHATRRYEEEYEKLLSRKSHAPGRRLQTVVEYLLEDLRDAESAGFFYQLWARAYHDPFVAKMMEGIYDRHRDNLAALMKPLDETMDEVTRRRRATILAALIEGLMLFIGYGKRRDRALAGLEREVLALAVRLASTRDDEI